METRPLGEPASDDRCLVGTVVVQNEMNGQIPGHRGVDRIEKPPKLDGAMAPMKRNYSPYRVVVVPTTANFSSGDARAGSKTRPPRV
jgi:hypothetical protein